MKTLVGVLALGVALAYSQPANAEVFVNITSNAVTLSCDSGLAVSATNCNAADGFILVAPDNIIFTTPGATLFQGYDIANLNVSSNFPGGPESSFVTDSKTTLRNMSATDDLTVVFGAYDFTLPPGPQLTFSASQTANWTTSVAGDSSAYTAWARSDNLKTPACGAVPCTTAFTPTIISPGGTTAPAPSQSGDLAFTRLATNFSIVGREIVTLAQGGNGSFTATAVVSAVPEPASMILLGTGLAALAARARRRLRK